jgi:glycosyl transferase family 25
LKFQPVSIYCINLARSTSRRERMEAEFRRVGWEVTFVPAMDGSNAIDVGELLRIGLLSPDNRSLRNPLSPAEIGCYLTHEHIWRWIQRTEQPYAIICEDDILIRDPTIDLARLVKKLPPSCDLFYFFHLNGAPGLTAPAFNVDTDPRVAKVGPYDIYSAWSCGGTQCYLITAQGVDKALASCRPIRHPVDGYLARMSFEGRMRSFAIHPMAVIDARLQSTIG